MYTCTLFVIAMLPSNSLLTKALFFKVFAACPVLSHVLYIRQVCAGKTNRSGVAGGSEHASI